MRLGVSIAQVGRLADPAVVRSAAAGAEQVGYSSLWVLDQLVDRSTIRRPPPRTDGVPLDVVRRDGVRRDGRPAHGVPTDGAQPLGAPADGAPPDGALPEGVGPALDPVGVLAYAAAVTSRVRLGTSVLVTPWYRPAVLARSLATLDVLSDGRLTVGLGTGWAPEDYAAAGVPRRHRAATLESTLDALDALGRACRGRAPSVPPPVQRPRPPVLLAAYTPAGLERIARRADGWNPAGLPIERIRSAWALVRDMAAAHGRDPDALELVPRATLTLTDRPAGSDRRLCTGTLSQMIDDVEALRRVGAHEVVIGLAGDPGFDEAMETYASLAEALDLRPWRSTRPGEPVQPVAPL
ncbi:MAG: LLM class flavin-dependent oxidoreductase [Acidimicrobiia bacterium]